jgi:hypothetical protein
MYYIDMVILKQNAWRFGLGQKYLEKYKSDDMFRIMSRPNLYIVFNSGLNKIVTIVAKSKPRANFSKRLHAHCLLKRCFVEKRVAFITDIIIFGKIVKLIMY